jgi:spore coat polysaccharide biosynthesis protein SpsF
MFRSEAGGPMRVGALVPVRLASERLAGKALLPIAGRPVIAHLLDRLFASRHLRPEDVVVCTTTDADDNPLVPVIEATGARIFRGSRDDIIDRFHQAVCQFGFDVVVQVDGDDLCADPLYMDLCLERLLADSSLGIVAVEGLPLGLASKAIRRSAIETVWERHTTVRNDTGFIYYFTRTGLCRAATLHPVSPGHQHPTARLTLDYPEDLAFFRALFGELYVDGRVFGVEEIVALLRRRPDLLAINGGLEERYWQRTRALAQLEYEVAGSTYRVEV